MNPPLTGREALLIEAVGELVDVLDRVQTLVPTLDASRREVMAASAQLTNQLSAIEARMGALAEAAKTYALNHISQRTNQMTRQSIDEHLKAMDEAARGLFVKELGPALQALVQPLRQAQQTARRSALSWDTWMTHAATAAVTAVATWLVTGGVGRL